MTSSSMASIFLRKVFTLPAQRPFPQAEVHKVSVKLESQVGTWTPLVT